MKIIDYTKVEPVLIDNEAAKGVKGRVIIGKDVGANNFCMRIFELADGGYSPRHSHEWEHELLVHSGSGEVFCNGEWLPIKPGNAVFIPGNEEHQIRNASTEPFVFACLIPSGVPEI